MNFTARSPLPFPISGSGDVPTWPHNGAIDEYADSPVKVIRSFLHQQELVYSHRSQWNNLFVVAAYDIYSNVLHIEPAANSFTYLIVETSTKLLGWRRSKLLEWHHEDALVPNLLAIGSPLAVFVSLEDHPGVSSEQLPLPLKKEFVPSKEIIDLWSSSVKSHVAELEASKPIPTSDSELRREFERTLQSTFGMVAQQVRYEDTKNIHLTQDGRFTPRLQLELCEQFLVGSYEASTFLTLLGKELLLAVSQGVEIKGAWGRVEQDSNGDLVYALTPPKRITDKSFVRATRVK
jgi:hypothetical protein